MKFDRAKEYTFHLREDMPSGFIDNESKPELPEVYRFLRPLNGITSTGGQLQDRFREFEDYITKKNIPIRDPHIRQGIFIFEENRVGVHNNGLSEQCHFGYLE
ncbi:MAG: hypothetical protein Q7S74_01605 [Nanoarchaeota archaeon]|nr:hypothetical protein [Nanoarchaeota archaeon]